ncbi:MAG: aspartate/glutamate racemase family protein [Jatrophihabitantaceae bacterium]
MKTIGVLGGMSSVASAEYYRLLNQGVNAALGGHAAAELVLYSVDFAVIEECIRTQDWDRAAGYLIERARRIERAGAEFLLLATNTLHRVAPQLQDAIGIPLVHVVDVVADGAIENHAKVLGLLGTDPVMRADFYRDRFAEHGIEILTPPEPDRAVVHRVIFDELTRGVISDDSRLEYLRIMGDLITQGAEGIVLGCTEISLLVAARHLPGHPLYDTTALHVERAVRLSLGLEPLPALARPSVAR